MRVDVSIVEAAAADGVASQTIQASDDALDRFAQDLHGAHGFDPAESRSVLDAIRSAGLATTSAGPLRPSDVTALPAEPQREDVTVLPVRRLRSQAVLAPPPAAPPVLVAPRRAGLRFRRRRRPATAAHARWGSSSASWWRCWPAR